MKKYIAYLLLMIVICTTVSCSKFLDKEPYSTANDGGIWRTDDDANSAVAACYGLLRMALNDGMAYYAYGDLPTDELSSAYGSGDYAFYNIKNCLWSLSIPAANTYEPLMKLRRYENFYRTIDQSNRCIKHIPAMAIDRQQEFLGEAYFTRAFSYFYMARVWGGVPLVLQAIEDVATSANIGRATEKEVLDQAIADVKQAIIFLPWSNGVSSDKAVRANKGAAYALLAHIYAWQGDYTNCAPIADSVISSGLYSFVDRNNYLNIYDGKSSEGIFEIAQNASNEGAADGNIAFYTLRSEYLTTNQGISYLPLNITTLSALYSDTTDLRRTKAFAFLSSTDPICIKYSNITYTGTGNTAPLAFNNIIIFRLSDITLLRAEALAATGNYGDARTLLDQIRALAGLSPSTATDEDLFEDVIDERGRELFLEGHRFYDLVRLAKKTGKVKFGDDKISASQFQQGKYYWPLDPVLITANSLLVQTPYWKGKL
ncbi:Starch-binding associating with outer membrane [Chitinophaga sp. CF118]|uniref:RagB/SusD family nutrient uptake outer membrane protein n=1 Tax=Chitinophaga sp. CF118 TaxID=1884367 RepID=UPI0008E5B9BD|nr:RagB/SusD family nutrient uptake outer membrane protein [Chitinophaga sp. CF118]SFD57512.1 Starch-binding associating with outer membrane [Chitinophaga sp. CF118]